MSDDELAELEQEAKRLEAEARQVRNRIRDATEPERVRIRRKREQQGERTLHPSSSAPCSPSAPSHPTRTRSRHKRSVLMTVRQLLT